MEHKIRISGRYENVQRVCDFIVEGAELEMEDAFHVRLACDEACTNIIEHSYDGEGRGEITASWQIKDGVLEIAFEDSGRPFEPGLVPEPIVSSTTDVEDLPVGGLGLHIIRQVMDDVHFEFTSKGNKLTVRKKLSGPEKV